MRTARPADAAAIGRRHARPPRPVVEADGAVVGAATVGPSRDDGEEADTGELWMLYLDPDAWGRGLGRLLHDESLDRLRADGYRRAYLRVLESNRRAGRFYQAAGWRPDGASRPVDADVLPYPEVRRRRLL